MSRSRWLIAAVSLLLVLIVTYWEFGRLTTPGPLHPTHARLSKLNGRFDCAACHGNDRTTMAQACLACHAEIGKQLADGAGLHGRIDAPLAQTCQRCHTEHNGGRVALVSPMSFVLAGIKDTDRYHTVYDPGFGLTGRHGQLRCERCHKLALEPMLREGDRRFVGLTQACTSCHEDPHRGSFGDDCASCHGQSQPFEQVSEFKHTERFSLVGGHGGVACVQCHEKASAYSVANLQAHSPPAVRSCVDCHTSPHRDRLLLAAAEASHAPPQQTCVACHDVMDKSFLYPHARMTPALHTAGAFALTPPHDRATCSACHDGIGSWEGLSEKPDLNAVFAKRFPSVAGEDCGACHKDPHAGQFAGGVTKGRCLDCHSALRFKPALFDVPRHARTGFALTGAHKPMECAGCHKSVNGVVKFAGVSGECAACHKDVHAGQFNREPAAGRCDACHDTTRFQPAVFDVERHAGTRFPLDGAHLAVGCRDCHVEARPARRFTNTPVACAECHKDAHNGLFDGVDKPVAVNGQRGCARCHTTERFDRVPWTGKAHETWTGYALVGAHAKASCADCHKDRADAGLAGHVFARLSRDCASCHLDPHAGQFRVGGVNDCSRCHDPGVAFDRSPFDHREQTRFALDQTHAKLDCNACHKAYRTQAGIDVVRYRPLGTRCQDCHGFESYEDKEKRAKH
ncbi:MAG: hypothetical protein GC164_04640 [Phycisphaera sp.]|nr:hypothetical protein [Phycisphaera sp.]